MITSLYELATQPWVFVPAVFISGVVVGTLNNYWSRKLMSVTGKRTSESSRTEFLRLKNTVHVLESQVMKLNHKAGIL